MQTAVFTKFPSAKRGRPPGSIADGKKTPEPVDIHVGGRIRMRRTMLGISQSQLGKKVGITFQQIQKYEAGTNRVSASRLQAIATYFGVPVSWFFESAPGGTPATAANTAAEEASGVTAFLSSPEGLALNRSFLRITDPKVRKKIVALVKALAADDTDSE